MTPQELMELLDAAGLTTRQYSGRGMYGKYCPAFEVESDAGMFIAALDIYIAADEMALSAIEVRKAMQNVITDSMGRGIVVYFPRYTFETVKL